MESKEEKKLIREKIKEVLNRLSEEQIRERSKKIIEKLFNESLFQKAKSIFCYASTEKEVQTDLILQKALKKGKKVYLPIQEKNSNQLFGKRILEFPNELVKGKFNILEPAGMGELLKDLNEIELFILPGIGFDLKGVRLGRGKGSFDTYLKDLIGSHHCYGLAFECQIFETLPCESHDLRLEKIITEDRIIKKL